MREIAAFGLILFVVWLVFPAGQKNYAKVEPPRAETKVNRVEAARTRPSVIREDGHVFKKIYDDGYRCIHVCDCGVSRLLEGD